MKKEKQTANTDPDEQRTLLVARFGEEKLMQWKKSFKKLSIIESDGKLAVLRPANSKDIADYSAAIANESGDISLGMIDGARLLLDNMWIDGDDDIRNNDDYFTGAMLQIQKLIEVKKMNFYTF